MTSERFELWKYFDSYKTAKRGDVALLCIRGTELVHDYTTIPLPPLVWPFRTKRHNLDSSSPM